MVAAVTLSHFLLDLITHRADLPLLGGDSYKLGLGLWNYPAISALVEVSIFLVGAWVYFRSPKGLSPGGKFGMYSLFGFCTGHVCVEPGCAPSGKR